MQHFAWDPNKARANLASHGVSFDEAMRVFSDPNALLIRGRVVHGEQRWYYIGFSLARVLVVVHTYIGDGQETTIRIISARKAHPRECRRYESGEAWED